MRGIECERSWRKMETPSTGFRPGMDVMELFTLKKCVKVRVKMLL